MTLISDKLSECWRAGTKTVSYKLKTQKSDNFCPVSYSEGRWVWVTRCYRLRETRMGSGHNKHIGGGEGRRYSRIGYGFFQKKNDCRHRQQSTLNQWDILSCDSLSQERCPSVIRFRAQLPNTLLIKECELAWPLPLLPPLPPFPPSFPSFLTSFLLIEVVPVWTLTQCIPQFWRSQIHVACSSCLCSLRACAECRVPGGPPASWWEASP